jgi:hypothetical protein
VLGQLRKPFGRSGRIGVFEYLPLKFRNFYRFPVEPFVLCTRPVYSKEAIAQLPFADAIKRVEDSEKAASTAWDNFVWCMQALPSASNEGVRSGCAFARFERYPFRAQLSQKLQSRQLPG